MKFKIVIAAIATTALSSVAMADGYDWGGVYGGVSGGVSGSNSNAKADYNNGTSRGWSDNGMFSTDAVVEDFYDTTRTTDWGSPPIEWEHNGTGGSPSSATGSLSGYSGGAGTPGFDPLTPWLSILENDGLNGAGSVRLGANFQAGSFVFGAEADGSLLLNETVVNRDFSESGSLEATSNGNSNLSIQSGSIYGFNYTSCNLPEDSCSYNTEYDAHYSQDGEFGYRSSIDSLFTFRGRAGFAAGRALFFATGGLAVGQIKMSTNSHTSEQSDSDWSGTGQNNLVSTVTDTGSSTTTANTSWEASDSKTAYGYAVGGGVSFAVTDNLIWTSDGYYYDLGRHSITARDNYDDSAYTISQRFDGYVVRTGMEWKF